MGPQQYINQTGYNQVNPQDQKFKKLMFIALILAVIGAVIFGASLIFGGNDTKDIVAKSIAYHQEELRLIDLAEDYKTEEIEYHRFVATAKTLIVSDQVSMQGLYGDEVSEKILLSVTDAEAQTRFEEAGKLNDLNNELKETMTKTIKQHLTVLRTLSESPAAELKEASQTAIGNREQLLNQLEEL